jgi:hypothetical protein
MRHYGHAAVDQMAHSCSGVFTCLDLHALAARLHHHPRRIGEGPGVLLPNRWLPPGANTSASLSVTTPTDVIPKS